MTREEAKQYLLNIANCMGTITMEYINEFESEETRGKMVEAVRVLYGSKEVSE